jgi:hypothetical protein
MCVQSVVQVNAGEWTESFTEQWCSNFFVLTPYGKGKYGNLVRILQVKDFKKGVGFH